jgi:hypothetical protein
LRVESQNKILLIEEREYEDNVHESQDGE